MSDASTVPEVPIEKFVGVVIRAACLLRRRTISRLLRVCWARAGTKSLKRLGWRLTNPATTFTCVAWQAPGV